MVVFQDGVISDMARTVDRIVEASKLPLSIVIVGVGGADFSNMEVLDADDDPLKNKYGELMSRDIVQFVPLRRFLSQGGANFSLVSPHLLSKPVSLSSLSFVTGKGDAGGDSRAATVLHEEGWHHPQPSPPQEAADLHVPAQPPTAR